MSSNPATLADVTPDGKLVMDAYQRATFRQALAARKGKRIEITVTEWKSTRSKRANNYYWSTVLPLLAASQQMTVDEMHDAMCAQFLPNEARRIEFFNKLTGECLTVDLTDTRRSSKLKGGEFFDFVERVRLFGVEFLGVLTPDPDREYWRKNEATRTRRLKARAA